MLTLITFIKYTTGNSSFCSKARKRDKARKTGKEDKTSLFGGNIILDADYLNQAKKKVLIPRIFFTDNLGVVV